MLKSKKLILILFMASLMIFLITGCSKEDNNQGGNGPDEPQALTIRDLYPLSEGDYWKFGGTGSEYAAFEQKVLFREDDRVQLQIVNAGTTMGMIYQFSDDELEVVYSQEELYEEDNILAQENQMTGNIILKNPIEVGTTWQTGDGRSFEIVAIDVTVETPAGNFTDCVEITSGFEDQNYEITLYYKPGLGLVKQIFEDEGFLVVQELEEYNIATYNE